MPPPSAANHEPIPGPALLRGLDHVMPTDTGWVAQCPVFGCDELLEITPHDGHWQLGCAVHMHQEVADYLQCDTRIDTRTPIRAWLALRLAQTPDAWAGLMLGLPVQPAVIDQLELRRQRKARLWR